ncbi:G2/M phase-specific E3 ubiquitin-protein ligase-like [Sinocyclocheilus rhinocerous]|uniref:G2/M phase-specific E3 ubiquitin-protein ligase-like n=1 Tax=Sinocyclocheilus rhinocerous TaxID=307959 RepID=UPI0007B82F22|nr:PREDICTED: G2/M phase-specific E3 ubiquitin-protein ligase-like [Sinocyclocheilus rhinocerous]
MLYQKGHILSAFEFQKEWDYSTTMSKLQEAFKDCLPSDVRLELMMPCGNNLVAPKVCEGQELSGQLIHKVFKSKTLYLRPSKEIECDSFCGDNRKDDSTDSETVTEITPLEHCHRTTELCSPPIAEPVPTQPSTLLSYSTVPCSSWATTPSTSPEHSLEQASTSSAPNTVNYEITSHDDYSAYLSVMTSFSDFSSDDEDLNQAILASIETHRNFEEVPIKNILLDLASNINYNSHCRFNINHSAVLEGAIRGFTRINYNPSNAISVKFSDDTGSHEEAVDLGGPRREFLRLLMQALKDSSMFEGNEQSQNLTLDSCGMFFFPFLLLIKNRYYIAGQANAVSLVHGGPAPGFLSQVLFSCLVNGPESAKPTLSDSCLNEKVKKIQDATNLKELLEATEPLLDYLLTAGCVRPLKSVEDRDLLVHDILMFQIVHRVQRAFERFRDGMKTLGVLDAIQRHPTSFRPILCHEPAPLTADVLEGLFEIRLSQKGNNKGVQEEVVVPFWRDYIQDMEDEEGPAKLEKILAFATGASCVPPVGFSPQPTIEFLHKEDSESAVISRFPMANTCINCLKLPLHTKYGEFKSSMDFAFANTHCFGME